MKNTNNRKIKVLYIQDRPLGGSGNSLLHMVDSLKNIKSYIYFGSKDIFYGSFKKLEPRIKINNAFYTRSWLHYLPKNFSFFWLLKFPIIILFHLLSILSLTIFTKRKKINIIHSNTLSMIEGAIVAKILKIPHIWHIRELIGDDAYDYSFKKSMITKIINKLSNKVFCDSNGTYNSLVSLGVKKNKIIIIGNIIKKPSKKEDIRELLDLPSRSQIVAIIGWVRPIKRVENFIKIAKKFNDGGLYFLIIGKSGGNFYLDKYKESLDKIINDNPKLSNIIFVGHVENITSYINSIDILVHCCEKEAFGRVIAESLLSETPAIAANSDATNDIIINNETGYVVGHNDIEQYAKYIQLLLSDENKKIKISKNGQKFVQMEFSSQSICKKLNYNYNDLI
jgi:glycosyltransferase involved in cell wall biosynthesis